MLKSAAALLGLFMLMLPPWAAGQAATNASEDALWLGGLRQMYFGDRPIAEGDDVISLDAPERAENAALVPIAVRAAITQTEPLHIRTLWLIVDKNPGPLAGKFQFTPRSGRADLGLRLRINEYTPVRAVAETSDGRLHMSRRFVKASGGCSAPAGSDPDAAMARLGQMKIKTTAMTGADRPAGLHLLVSHPNANGLQMDQTTGLYTPARFVKHVRLTFDGAEIFSGETSFAISENPSFELHFVPEAEGELTAEVIDTEDARFVHSQRIAAGGALAHN